MIIGTLYSCNMTLGKMFPVNIAADFIGTCPDAWTGQTSLVHSKLTFTFLVYIPK